jgi:hypothetical protein
MKEQVCGLREGAIPEFVLSEQGKFLKNLNQNNNSKPSWFEMSSTWKQNHTTLIISGNRIFARRKWQEL